MFVYGVCIGNDQKYAKYAKASLDAVHPGAIVLERRQQKSILLAYNSILDEAASLSDVEGLVLLHEDVELRAPIEDRLKQHFFDPAVAIVGAVGGEGVRSVRWSRARRTFGRAPDSFYGDNDHGKGDFDVDVVDGLLLALSPWAIRELRFDQETFHGFHAYDADICMQARAANKIVRVTHLDLFHHTKGGFGDPRSHRRDDDLFRQKWHVPRDSALHRLKSRLRGTAY